MRQGFFGQEINLTTHNLCRINMLRATASLGPGATVGIPANVAAKRPDRSPEGDGEEVGQRLLHLAVGRGLLGNGLGGAAATLAYVPGWVLQGVG